MQVSYQVYILLDSNIDQDKRAVSHKERSVTPNQQVRWNNVTMNMRNNISRRKQQKNISDSGNK